MPRGPMSEAHKKKLAKGRQEAAQAKHKVEDKRAKDWLTWMKADARLYQAYRQLVDAEADKEAQRAYRAWMKNKALQPSLPTSASVKRVRGMLDID